MKILAFSLCVIKTIFSKTGEDPTHWPWEYLQKSVCFPLSLFIYVRPWQQCLLCLPHALPHIPNLKQNRDPGRLYKGRPSAVHAQKDSTFASLAKGGKRSERGWKKVAKSVTAARRREKVGPTGPAGEEEQYLHDWRPTFRIIFKSFIISLNS